MKGRNLEGTKVLKGFQIYEHKVVQSQGGVTASFSLAHLRPAILLGSHY